jgi:hypothetical protein
MNTKLIQKMYYRPGYWPHQTYQDILIECRDEQNNPIEATIEMRDFNHNGEISARLCIFTDGLAILPLLHAVMLTLPDPTTEGEIAGALDSLGFTEAKRDK